jgi:hypothetical protein
LKSALTAGFRYGSGLENNMNPFHTPAAFLSGDGLRVWTNPSGSPNFIVLLRGSLYTATIPDAEMAMAVRDLSAGMAPQAVLGESTREICLISASQAALNRRNNSLRITYVTALGTTTDCIFFPYKEDLEEIQFLLQKQLGETFLTEPLGFSVRQTLGGPLLALVIEALLFLFCWTVVVPGSQQRRIFWHERFLQDQVGSRHLIWAAAVTASFTLIWAYWRVLTRPVGVRIRKVVGKS